MRAYDKFASLASSLHVAKNMVVTEALISNFLDVDCNKVTPKTNYNKFAFIMA